jgi:hypothetical protein
MERPIFADLAIGTTGIFVSLLDSHVRCVKRYDSLPAALSDLRDHRLINEESHLQHTVYDTDPRTVHYSFDLSMRPTLSELQDLGFSLDRQATRTR